MLLAATSTRLVLSVRGDYAPRAEKGRR